MNHRISTEPRASALLLILYLFGDYCFFVQLAISCSGGAASCSLDNRSTFAKVIRVVRETLNDLIIALQRLLQLFQAGPFLKSRAPTRLSLFR